MLLLTDNLRALAIALGLGLLVGLQRERSSSVLAGFRTFPLVAAFGVACAILGREFGGWIVAAGILVLGALMVTANTSILRRQDADPGMTTEAAVCVVFGVGLLLGTGHTTLAIVLGATTAVLLHLKPQLHGFARHLGETDMRAIMQFTAIALVILPVLPDETFGPFQVLNPRRMWWMVVLITGISLGGYVAQKWFGGRGGAAVGGILGGLVSSTATTVSYARRSREEGAVSASLSAVVIVLASTVVFARVLAVLAASSPAHFRTMAPPLAMMLPVMGILAFVIWWRSRRESTAVPASTNPTELKSALIFTVLFGGVLLAVAAAREYLGSRGMFAVAVASGLTDMDAITLSTSQMLESSRVESALAWRLILAAALANLVFKTGVVIFLGSRALARQVGLVFGIALVAGLAVMAFWK